jgi:hypothetical protein
MKARPTRPAVVVSSPFQYLRRESGGNADLGVFVNAIEKSVDPWGEKFLDYASDMVKQWMTSGSC